MADQVGDIPVEIIDKHILKVTLPELHVAIFRSVKFKQDFQYRHDECKRENREKHGQEIEDYAPDDVPLVGTGETPDKH